MATVEEGEAGEPGGGDTVSSADISQAVLTQTSGWEPRDTGPPASLAFFSVKMVMEDLTQLSESGWSWAMYTCTYATSPEVLTFLKIP